MVSAVAALRVAIREIGGERGQSGLADALTSYFEGVQVITPNRVNKWLNKHQSIPFHIAQAIEVLAAGRVTALQLNPDPELQIHENKYAQYLGHKTTESTDELPPTRPEPDRSIS